MIEAAHGSQSSVAVGDGRVERYQVNAPTTWNFWPRNSFDADGPL